MNVCGLCSSKLKTTWMSEGIGHAIKELCRDEGSSTISAATGEGMSAWGRTTTSGLQEGSMVAVMEVEVTEAWRRWRSRRTGVAEESTKVVDKDGALKVGLRKDGSTAANAGREDERWAAWAKPYTGVARVSVIRSRGKLTRKGKCCDYINDAIDNFDEVF